MNLSALTSRLSRKATGAPAPGATAPAATAPAGAATGAPAKARFAVPGLAGGGLFARQATPIGLDLGSRHLKVALLKSGVQGPQILALLDGPLPKAMVAGDEILDPEGLSDEVVRLLAGANVKRARATLAVGGGDVLVKRLAVPRAAKLEALRALPANASLKFGAADPESAKYELEVLDPAGTGPSMQILAVAAKKDAIRARQKVVTDAGVGVYAVDVDAFALFNCFAHCLPTRREERITLLHLGYEGALVVLAEGGAPLHARHADVGVAALLEYIAGPSQLVTAEEAERAVFTGQNPAVMYPDAFSEWLDALAAQIQHSVQSLKKGEGGLGEVLVSGGGALIEDLPGMLRERLGVPVQIFDPVSLMPRASGFQMKKASEGPVFALALGLALRQAE